MEGFEPENKKTIEAKIKNIEDRLLSLGTQEANNPAVNVEAQRSASERELTELREKLTKF